MPTRLAIELTRAILEIFYWIEMRIVHAFSYRVTIVQSSSADEVIDTRLTEVRIRVQVRP